MTSSEPKTVLIVDDNENDAQLLRILVAGAGVFNPTHITFSAEEAVAYLVGKGPNGDRARHAPPGIIFLDLSLPGIDGFEFLRWLRTQLEFKSIFVVVLSGRGDTVSVQTAYALGGNSFLTKPCSAADLENLISAYPDFWARSIIPGPSPAEGATPGDVAGPG